MVLVGFLVIAVKDYKDSLKADKVDKDQQMISDIESDLHLNKSKYGSMKESDDS